MHSLTMHCNISIYFSLLFLARHVSSLSLSPSLSLVKRSHFDLSLILHQLEGGQTLQFW